MKKKIVVIGGGPGGYVAAIRGAQLGANVTLIERGSLGGTCLNVGCIPTKALLHSAEIYEQIKAAKTFGIEVENVLVNWAKVQQNKDRVVRRLVAGVGGLCKANGVTVHKGEGVILDKNTVLLNGEERISADNIIIATGSSPAKIPFEGNDLEGVIDSTGALALKEIPKSMVIVGGGVIGIEFANLFSSFGTKVRVLELLPEILPMIDCDITREIKKELASKGVEFYNGARLVCAQRGESGLTVAAEKEGETLTLEGEYVLVAIGRKSASENIGLEAVGVACERSRICVDENFETNAKGIYAIGDCNGKIMLAHAASAQGIAAVEHAMGHRAEYRPETIASCIYTSPEIASVGLSEAAAREANINVKIGKFSLGGNGKSQIENGGKGLVKFVVEAETEKVLGVHIIGPRATDLVAEAALAIRLSANVNDIISTIHAHPTVSEAIAEAALDVRGIAIHWPPEAK